MKYPNIGKRANVTWNAILHRMLIKINRQTSIDNTPPPPEGFISPMLWGVEDHVIERFGSAGVAKENLSFVKDTFEFNAHYTPAQLVNTFRNYYGPTMNAFEAAEKNEKAADLQHELEVLFTSQNKSTTDNFTSIAATFLKVTVIC